MSEQQTASVTVYTSGPQCIDCNTVKRWLGEHGYTFTERNIRADADALAKLRQLGYSSVPVTVVNDTVIDGLDLKALQAALQAR
jgi:glutaredoxin-like protein NrdH